MADAEKRQATDELVRLWLRRLKDVAYDADDVIDDFSYEAMRKSERGDRLKYKVRDFISSSNPLIFRFKMVRKIRDINQRLDKITEDMGRFQLQITTPGNTSIACAESSEQRSRHTTSFSTEPEIVGRQNDKNNILDILIKETPSSSTLSDRNLEKVSVISIVGMGGLGKTTLAQLVYQDELVKRQFDLKMWVHVSESFDLENLLTKIMESAIQTKFDTGSNLDVLVIKARKQLDETKYLLVLDDLWEENPESWDRLKSVLQVGAQGSKILITTRKDQVASIVRDIIPPYILQQLPDDACWSMIQQKAFYPGGASDTKEMRNIGKEIAKKCCGLPLAVKFLGGLLHSKNKESDWISISSDNTWSAPESQNKILPVLKLSYNNLPSHLKQCFSFCAIFPKNWEIRKETLIRMWMAEGFIKPSKVENKRLIEDIGNEYFEILVWSSFFHKLKKSGNMLNDIETCEMHDLVHDLAENVLRDSELVSLKMSEFGNTSEARWLRLTVNEETSTTYLKKLSNAKKLRTIFVLEGSNLLVDPVVFSRSKHLRVLHASPSPDSNFLKLPHLCYKMRHLRYLYLSNLNLIEIVNVQSINKLFHLETLALTYMDGVQNLLKNIQSLKKLRHLEISWTDLEELPDSVTSLCNLQTLDLNHCDLKVIPDSISGLKHLKSPNLSFNKIIELSVVVLTLSNLQTLDVNSCQHLKTLESVAGLANLKLFNFKYCPLFKALPKDFWALTQLNPLTYMVLRLKNYQSLVLTSGISCMHIFSIARFPKMSEIGQNLENLFTISGEIQQYWV
ncbi:putative disease resistance protein RGA4 [Papaver somniferum]|uniref:putative disease resistance protein RGA4 n=1 Tax=Papaver somniferum TaxID=3469 RepID=UPI000E7055A8|nr:putative disease resistance protein RGA4 [Papaver somniferum]XP_026382959.1 putative disease resistance protein RGA4 [Papaver somniferum]XP_026382960.1 putative disease resistance protein RGA4 [Papaver somniferum]